SVVCVFFFSSRRRHTRLVSDWSSDVCSSDLFRYTIATSRFYCWDSAVGRLEFRSSRSGLWQWYSGTIVDGILVGRFSSSADTREIGRASCRERGGGWWRGCV